MMIWLLFSHSLPPYCATFSCDSFIHMCLCLNVSRACTMTFEFYSSLTLDSFTTSNILAIIVRLSTPYWFWEFKHQMLKFF